MTGLIRLCPLLFGVTLGVAAYVAISLETLLGLIDPDVVAVGREVNDSVAIAEALREVDDQEGLVLYIVGGSSAYRNIDEKVVEFLLTERLGRTVTVINLATIMQSITDSDVLLSMLPPGRPGRSYILYTWAGRRLQTDLVTQITGALTFAKMPVRSPLIENYRSRLEAENIGWFHRSLREVGGESCNDLMLVARSRRTECFLPLAREVEGYILKPGAARTMGSRALFSIFFADRSNKRLPSTRRPVTADHIARANATYVANPARNATSRQREQMRKDPVYATSPKIDRARQAAFLLHTVVAAQRRGYEFLFYEIPIWKGALRNPVFNLMRVDGRRLVERVAAASRTAWVNQGRVNDKDSASRLYFDLTHNTLHGKLLTSIEVAESLAEHLQAAQRK